ncbi:MAG: NADH-quinone oxidoreductase subunit C, partial [Dehalococcoides mccartyi]
MLENAEYIKAGELLDHTQKLYDEGAIFCTASCVDLGNEFEVIYHYNLEKGLRMKHLRLKIDKNETVPSISNIYLCASLIENEMQELYQLKLSKIAIDFSGGFLVTKETPTSYMIKAPDYKLIPVERLTAPCQKTCPAGIDVSRYVRLCGEGNYDAALAV